MMLETICRYLNNYFDTERVFDTFTISSGGISGASSDLTDKLVDGRFFRIAGSVFNDGIYMYPSTAILKDETFEGAIWLLAFPDEFLKLVRDIEDWQKKYGSAAASPFSTESVTGVYSYTKSTAMNGSSAASTWQGAFADRLKLWRKIV